VFKSPLFFWSFLGLFFIISIFNLAFGIPIVSAQSVLKSSQSSAQSSVSRSKIEHVKTITTPIAPRNQGVNMSFDHAGKVSKVYVKTGDTVVSGQKLIELDISELLPQLHKAQAAFDAQRIKIDTLKSGQKTEDIITAENNLNLAIIERDNDLDDLSNVINSAYINAEDAVRDKIDQFFITPTRSISPQLVFTLNDAVFQGDISQRRLNIESALTAWKLYLDTTPQPYSDPSAALIQARQSLNQTRDFVEKAALAVNQGNIDTTATAYNLHLWKSDTFSARNNINTAIKNLIAEDKKIKDVYAKVKLMQSILDAKNLALSPLEITNQEVQLRTLQSQVEALQAYINKMTLNAPSDGKIEAVFVKAGASVIANQIGLSFLSN
jgi:multidrug efflux pump subunit AcrA (membrane-fusion protein)